jgi:EmrB/QacA subfamily drug resistance transporter
MSIAMLTSHVNGARGERRANTQAPAAEQAPGAVHRLALPVVLAAVFMAALDFFIVNVAIPSTQRDLGASAMAIEWVVAGYGLAYGVGLITGGRLGDLYGRRRIFRVGMAAFTLASLACGLAPTPTILIAARVAQGLAAALMSPQVLAIIRSSFPGAVQAKAFGAYALTMGLAAVFGQLIGGLLIQADLFGWGWRTCFLINVPVGIAALALAGRVVPESRGAGRVTLDLGGVLLVTTALVAITLPLIEGRQEGWPLWTWLSLAAAPALFAVFAVTQRRRAAHDKAPLIDVLLFGQRAFTSGLLAQLVFWMGQASFFLVLALYLQQGRGLSALNAGLIFVAIGVGYFATSTNAHRVYARLGRQTIAVGGLIMAGALGALQIGVANVGLTGHIIWLTPALVFEGAGMGLGLAPLVTTVLSRVAPHQAGAAGGVLTTAQQVGNALGVAIIGIVFYTGLGRAEGADRFPTAFNHSLTYLMVVEVALVAFVQLLPKQREGVAAAR